MTKNVLVSGNRSMKSAGNAIRWMSTAVDVAEKSGGGGGGGVGGWKLYKRLSALGNKKGLVQSTINEYIREGKRVRKEELSSCIKELRRFGRHNQALEIMEWMDTRTMIMSFTDHATRLDLISKVHGVAAAENYFNDLVPQQKNKYTYGALLNCYCVEKMKDKALELVDKMDEAQIEPTSLAFNNLMSLYMRLNEPEKVTPLVEEMKKRNVQLSTFTYNVWMNSYSCSGDIGGVERVFEEIKQEGERKCDWTSYSNLAVAYVRAGLKEKAELALKILENEMKPQNREAFHYMLSLYANISNLGEVHRIWKSLKSNLMEVTNLSYLTMLQALSKLNDIDGLKKLFEEWESTCSSYDIRLVNRAIGAFLRHGMVNEAESVLRRALNRSKGPFFIAWESLMIFYLDNHKLDDALRCLEGATSGLNETKSWHPSSDAIRKFLIYCKEAKDVNSAEELVKHLKKVNCLDHNVHKKLLETYIAAGRKEPTMRKRFEGDSIEIDSELDRLLSYVACDAFTQNDIHF